MLKEPQLELDYQPQTGEALMGHEDLPKVTHLDGYGVGAVEPTDVYSDEQVAHAIVEAQKPIEDPAIVCIDERESVEGAQPVRRKLAGGGAVSGFAGALGGGWSKLKNVAENIKAANIKEAFSYTVKFLADNNVKLGAHIDNHAAEDKTNCGAADGFVRAISAIVGEGYEDIKTGTKLLMGKDFDEAIYQEAVNNYAGLLIAGFFDDWESTQVPGEVKAVGGVVEVLNGDNTKPELDPTNARHGHYAEAINKGANKRKSNDRDNAAIPFFQLDAAASDELRDVMATDSVEARRIEHAMYAYNAAIARMLTKNQRYTETS